MIPFLLTLTPADVHISHEIFSVPWNAHPATGIRTCCTTGRFAPLAWPFVLDPWQSARTSSVPWHNQVKGTKYQFLPGYIRYIYILYTVYIYIYIHIYTVRDITFYYGYDSMGTFIGDMNSYESPPAQRNVLFCIVSKIGRAMASKRKIWTADRNQSWLNNKERVNPGQLVANCLVIRKLFATITWLTNQTWCFFGGRYLTLVINKKMHLRKLSQRRWYYLKGTHPAKPYMKT